MRKSIHSHSWLINEWGISCDACLKQFITSHTEVSKTLLQYDGVLIKVYFLLFYMFEFVLTKRFVSFRFPPCLLKYNSCTVKRPVLSAQF